MIPEVTSPHRSRLFQLVCAKPGAPACSSGSKEVVCELSMPPPSTPLKCTLTATGCGWLCKATALPSSAKVVAKRSCMFFICWSCYSCWFMQLMRASMRDDGWKCHVGKTSDSLLRPGAQRRGLVVGRKGGISSHGFPARMDMQLLVNARDVGVDRGP